MLCSLAPLTSCPHKADSSESWPFQMNVPPMQASHRAVKAIGRGAAADTWLFMDKKRNRLVAVKLFQRPIPDALRDSTVREITVILTCKRSLLEEAQELVSLQ